MRLVALLSAMLLVACGPQPAPTSGAPGVLHVEAVAGPVCPVERDPPDPGCAPRPVAGARVFVQPGDGRDIVVGEATTDAGGRASIELPPGDYVVHGGEVEGLMGRPEPMTVSVAADQSVTITLGYDTGIR